MHFPIIKHTTPQTQFAIRGQLNKVKVPLKLLQFAIQCFEKRKKIYQSCLYPLLKYDILCVILIHFCSQQISTSTGPFFLTHPIQYFESKEQPCKHSYFGLMP